MQSLVSAVAEFAAARHLDDVPCIVPRFARASTHAEGVTFVLREGTDRFNADENEIAVRWHGKRLAIEIDSPSWTTVTPPLADRPAQLHFAHRHVMCKWLH